MTFKERYHKEREWSKKVLIAELCHHMCILKYGSAWSGVKTAKVLNICHSRLSNALKIAKSPEALLKKSHKQALFFLLAKQRMEKRK
jgi:hypothetical protein